MLRVIPNETGPRVETARYRLSFPADRPYALLEDGAGEPWADLFLGASLHSREGLDETLRLAPPVVAEEREAVRITVAAASSHWKEKIVIFRCRDDALGVSVQVRGSGHLTDVHLLGGYYSGHLRFGSGFFPSGARFHSLFNPEPWGGERRAIPAGESTVIDVTGTGALPGKRHWIFTPAPFCYAVSKSLPPAPRRLRAASAGADQGGAPGSASTEDLPAAADEPLPAGPWMAIGLATRPGEHLFTGFHYDGLEEGFSLRLSYEGQSRVDGSFQTPELLFLPGWPDPYAALEGYVKALRELGLVAAPPGGEQPAWWREPIFCGWGAQFHLANVRGGRAPDLCTQENYDRFLKELASQGLHPGIITVDDKWSLAYGRGEADPARWPDLKGWIGRRHVEGARVLLWWKAWDPEGLPAEQCVRNHLGEPVAADPSNPAYEEALRRTVRRMLGPEGYDADGLKVDFTARTPSGPGLVRHGREWGVELLYRLLWILYDEAKRVKPDALLVTHTPNPYFAAVSDMIRLNDINTGSPVVGQMIHRARVARAACPSLLVDTDNWPMPSRDAWRAYLSVQGELGVPSLYYTTHLDSMEPLESEDYAALRRLWARTRGRGPHTGEGGHEDG